MDGKIERLVERLLDIHERMMCAVRAQRPYPVKLRMGEEDTAAVLNAAAVIQSLSERIAVIEADALETARQRALVLFQAYARGVAQRHGRSEGQFIHDVDSFDRELTDALSIPSSCRAVPSLTQEPK